VLTNLPSTPSAAEPTFVEFNAAPISTQREVSDEPIVSDVLIEPQNKEELPSLDAPSASGVERVIQGNGQKGDNLIETIALSELDRPELPTYENMETTLREQFSPARFNRAMQTLDRYGPEEGLRRLKDADPEVAKQVERLP